LPSKSRRAAAHLRGREGRYGRHQRAAGVCCGRLPGVAAHSCFVNEPAWEGSEARLLPAYVHMEEKVRNEGATAHGTSENVA
jgi:hypothetical protein